MTTLHHHVLADLGPRVVSGELADGRTVTMEWVCEEYDVSRTVAREAVQVLASMNLVESRRRTGITVLPSSEWDDYNPAVIRWRLAGPRRATHLYELSQLRAAIEPAATELAAERASSSVREELVHLSELLEATGSIGDLATFLEHDVRFHRLLLETSGNPMFGALCDVVEEVLRGRTDHDLMPEEPKPEARRLHAEVARSVAAGDADTAREAMAAICLEVVAAMSELTD